MQKLDYKKEFKALYQPPRGKFVLVDAPPLQFLMIDGEGNPNTSDDYAKVVGTLYAISYKTKFLSKKEAGIDYVVMPLEGLWFAENLDVYSKRDLDRWQWTMMIMQPEQAEWTDSNGSPMALYKYNDLRRESNPRKVLLDFMESAYQAGWDVEEFQTPALSEM